MYYMGSKPQKPARRKWSVTEELNLLNYLLNLKPEFEKPTSKEFYTRAVDILKIPVTATKMKQKLISLRLRYYKTMNEMSSLKCDKNFFKQYAQTKCRHFELLNAMFGKNDNNNLEERLESDSDDSLIMIETDDFPQPQFSGYPSVKNEMFLEYKHNAEWNDQGVGQNNNSQNQQNPENQHSFIQMPIASSSRPFSTPSMPFAAQISPHCNQTQTQQMNPPKRVRTDNALENGSNCFCSPDLLLQKRRIETLKISNPIEYCRITMHAEHKTEELKLAESKLKLKNDHFKQKHENYLQIKRLEIESQEKIEKMKIDLELAKLNRINDLGIKSPTSNY